MAFLARIIALGGFERHYDTKIPKKNETVLWLVCLCQIDVYTLKFETSKLVGHVLDT